MPARDAVAAAAFMLAANEEETKSSGLKKAFASIDREANPDVGAVVELLLWLQGAGPVEAPSSEAAIGDCIGRSAGPPGQTYTIFPGRIFEARPPGPGLLTLFPPAAFRLPKLPGGEEGEGGDEGYASPTLPLLEDNDDDIWELVAGAGPPEAARRWAWEQPGRRAPPAPPLLSGAGAGAVLHLWALAAASLRLIDPEYCPAPPRPVTSEELGRHLGFLAAGIPSRSFPLHQVPLPRQGPSTSFHQDSSAFTIAPGLCLSTLSPETLESFAR
jgi:hypothetical protein